MSAVSTVDCSLSAANFWQASVGREAVAFTLKELPRKVTAAGSFRSSTMVVLAPNFPLNPCPGSATGQLAATAIAINARFT